MKKVSILDVCKLNDQTVKEFTGTKEYVATGGIEKDKIVSSTKVSFEEKPSRANREVEIGDILLAKMKDTVKVLLINEENKDYIYSTGFFTIKPDTTIVNTEYIYYVLKSEYFQEEKDKLAKGATQKALNNADLKKIKIPVPSKTEQERIVKALKNVESTLRKRQQQIEALLELKQSVFYKMFGTYNYNTHNLQKAKLGEFATLVTSGSTPRGGAKSYLDEGIPLIRSQNVLRNKFDLDDVAHISEDTHKSMKRSQLKNRDVLLNITGASIGRSVVFNEDDYSANVNQHVCIIRLNEKMNPYYLTYYFSSDEFQNNVVNKNVGATRQAFNYTQIKNFDVLVPDIESQKKFEDRVKEIDRQISSLSKSLEKMDALYNSLLHKTFNGELFKEKANA